MSLHTETYRWTVDEFEKLGETGFFQESGRVELLNGEIFVMSPTGYRHNYAVQELTEFFSDRRRRRYITRPQCTVILNDGSDVLPDLALLRPVAHRYRRQHPVAEDVLLLVEVADSSLGYDRHDKLPVYAAEGIAEVWIVNLRAEQLEVYREPAGVDYAVKTIHAAGETIAPLAFPDLLLPVADVLP